MRAKKNTAEVKWPIGSRVLTDPEVVTTLKWQGRWPRHGNGSGGNHDPVMLHGERAIVAKLATAVPTHRSNQLAAS